MSLFAIRAFAVIDHRELDHSIDIPVGFPEMVFVETPNPFEELIRIQYPLLFWIVLFWIVLVCDPFCNHIPHSVLCTT